MNSVETTTSLHPKTATENKTLREYVEEVLEFYFKNLDGQAPANLYNMVLEEVEVPLLQAVLKHAKGNQCKAAVILGISRGTLRKKLQQYGLDGK